MKFRTQEVRKAFKLPPNAISYQISCWLSEVYPDRAIERVEGYFGLEEFARAGNCRLEPMKSVLPEYDLDCRGVEYPVEKDALQIFYQTEWQGHQFEILQLKWHPGGYNSMRCHWIVGADSLVVQAFYKAISDYNGEIREEILVFSGGCFHKSEQLYQDIQSSRLENLVLPGTVKEELAQDCQEFFESEELYARYGVPWKRGYLLMGPPGNGKSHAVKALLNHLKKPCIYVQSFNAEHSTDHSVMKELFKRARVTTPCILVLEDLDSLINDGNRSFFLNELDGFASNHGILTIATTNHPDRLDPAILERPSRFDRKYTFRMPAVKERLAYLKLWNERLEKDLRCSVAALEKVAKATDGFSFAFLMMAWMRQPGKRKMEQVMLEVCDPLKEQVTRPLEVKPDYSEDED